MEPDTSTGGRRWWALAALCLLGAFRWRLADLWPESASTALSGSLGCATACLVSCTYAGLHRVSWLRLRAFLAAFCAGALMLGGPALVLLIGRHSIDESAFTMALALIPVVVAVVRPLFRETHAPELAGRLWPGIAAVAGLLLVLPQPSFESGVADVTLIAAPVLSGVGAAWLRSSRGASAWKVVSALCGATFLFLVAAIAAGELRSVNVQGIVLAAVFDGLAAWLSVLALLRVGATRWSSQFVLIPLLIVVESVLMVWPGRDMRMWTGVVLLALSSFFLLLPPRADAVDDLSIQPERSQEPIRRTG